MHENAGNFVVPSAALGPLKKGDSAALPRGGRAKTIVVIHMGPLLRKNGVLERLQARGIAMFGTMALGLDDKNERSSAIAATKVQIGRSGKYIGQQSIQLHGGVGMTQEYKIGH